MEQPVEITLTTYWLDWLLLPVSLFLGWMTSRWAVSDYRRALQLNRDGAETVPAVLISLPLFISALGWVILGCASKQHMEIPVGIKVVILSHVWTALSLICVVFLSIGLLKGFTYNYTRFALAIGILIFIGLGGIELDSGQSAFPWFSRIWDLQLEQGEFEAMLPEARIGWRIIGGLKFLFGIGIGVFLIISRRIPTKRNHKHR